LRIVGQNPSHTPASLADGGPPEMHSSSRVVVHHGAHHAVAPGACIIRPWMVRPIHEGALHQPGWLSARLVG
jgi:hypothetical protein